MEQRVRFGVCVSCGRSVGIHQSSCPYCAEWVYLPRWFRWGRACLCAGVLICSAWILVRDAAMLFEQFTAFHGLPAYLSVAGVVVLFFPESFERAVIVSLREHLRCVCRDIGVAAILLMVGLACGWVWASDATAYERAASGLLLGGSVLGALAYGVSLPRIAGPFCMACAWLLA